MGSVVRWGAMTPVADTAAVLATRLDDTDTAETFVATEVAAAAVGGILEAVDIAVVVGVVVVAVVVGVKVAVLVVVTMG